MLIYVTVMATKLCNSHCHGQMLPYCNMSLWLSCESKRNTAAVSSTVKYRAVRERGRLLSSVFTLIVAVIAWKHVVLMQAHTAKFKCDHES
jgi:hypothetical protein